MTWWKFIYDTKTPTWSKYGAVAFVQAETEADANVAALAAARAEFPGAEILPHAIGQSTPEAAALFSEKRRRHALWQQNARTGVPNTRELLEVRQANPAGATPPVAIRAESAHSLSSSSSALASSPPASAPPSDCLREQLAALAHEQWTGWMRYLFSRCQFTGDGVRIPNASVTHWQRQMDTPYERLTEREKDSDRKEADRVLSLLSPASAPQHGRVWVTRITSDANSPEMPILGAPASAPQGDTHDTTTDYRDPSIWNASNLFTEDCVAGFYMVLKAVVLLVLLPLWPIGVLARKRGWEWWR